jgi:kinesin family protein 6/9
MILGKTYTICGGEKFQDRGLIPRTIGYLFEEIRLRQQKAGIYKCQISFTEVYKEDVYDLLDPQKRLQPVEQWTPVQVLEAENGLTLRNVNVFEVENEEEALSLYFMGSSNRVTGSTAINMASSRSHAIFSLIVETQSIKNGKTVFTYGKVNLVDLAGSERVYKVRPGNMVFLSCGSM